MRTRTILLIAFLLMGTHGEARAERDFRFGGVVLVGSVGVDGQEPERAARCDYLLRGEASAGGLGAVFQIPSAYADGLHAFRLVDGLMGWTDGLPLGDGVDFDVTFTDHLGGCAEPLERATRFHSPGNEQGLVPEGTRYAVVIMRTVQRPESSFDFTIAGID